MLLRIHEQSENVDAFGGAGGACCFGSAVGFLWSSVVMSNAGR